MTAHPEDVQPEVRLVDLAAKARAGERVESITVRELLHWFGAERRGFYIVRQIRGALEGAGLVTVPDFESEYIDSYVSLALAADKDGVSQLNFETSRQPASEATAPPDETLTPMSGGADPTIRIGMLAAANTRLVSVRPDGEIKEALTLMLLNDFSQLPVMQNARSVKGIVSWATIGKCLLLQTGKTSVRDCLVQAQEVSADDSLFDVIDRIIRYEYVLVRGKDDTVTGIVTTADLGSQFRQLGEPFLLLGEIENHLRRIVDGRFSTEELRTALNPQDKNRTVSTVADLTFGEYVRLFESPNAWARLSLPVDRSAVARRLDEVRRIRNDVMHFDPDGISTEDLMVLRKVAQFLQTLRAIGATK
jgi:CBS domain-containing protein